MHCWAPMRVVYSKILTPATNPRSSSLHVDEHSEQTAQLSVDRIHNIVTYIAAPPSSSVHRRKSPSRIPSRLLPLPSVLSTLASRVTCILDSTSQALQSVANSLGAGGVVDRVSDSAACGSDDSTSSLCDAADCVAEL